MSTINRRAIEALRKIKKTLETTHADKACVESEQICVGVLEDYDEMNKQLGMDRGEPKALLIKQCPDPLMWYAGLVGQAVPYLDDYGDGTFKSREPAGFANIVKHEDAEVVW